MVRENELFDLLKLDIVTWAGLSFRFSLWLLRSLAISARWLLHALIHFPKTFFYAAAGPVNRYHKVKYEPVGQVDQECYQQKSEHDTKINYETRIIPVISVGLPKFGAMELVN